MHSTKPLRQLKLNREMLSKNQKYCFMSLDNQS